MTQFLSSFFRRGLIYVLPLAMLAALTTARLVIPEVLDRLGLFAFDLYQQVSPRQPTTDLPVRIVDIDDASLKRIGQWPWPRSTIAKLLDQLREAGALVVGLDILFSEPDRTSPALLLPLIAPPGTDQDAAKKILANMPNPDDELAAAMRKLPVVAGFVLVHKSGTKTIDSHAGYSHVGGRDLNPLIDVEPYPEAIGDLPVLQKAAAGEGFLNQYLDWDHIVRRVPLIMTLDGRPVWSLVAELLRVAQGAPGYLVNAAGSNAAMNFGENTGLNAIRIGDAKVHTDRAGRVWLHYAETDPGRYISAADILAGTFDKGKIANNIVLIGSSATALQDLQATPVARDVPGVDIHAQLIEQVMQGDYLTRPDWAIGAEIIFSVVISILLIVLLPRIGALASAELGITAIIVVVAASWLAFRYQGLMIDPVYPVMVVGIVYLLASLLGYLQTERRQREIRNAFSRYMSPEYVAELAQHPEKLVLGGETRLLTIMFCDIRGFTTLAEGLDAQSLTKLMNGFLAPMTEIIAQHRGTIDKFIGDCIMAFWNAPLDDPDHAKNAVRAAQGMRAGLAELNRQWEAEAKAEGKPYKPLRAGIGINTGECVVGNFGSVQRFDYSILGDPVNLASRLESLGKLYGIDLVIGEDTAERLDDPNLVEIDLVAVKGKSRAVRVHTLPPHPDEAQRYLAKHAELLAAYRRRDWAGALQLLDNGALAGEAMLTPVYNLYRRRIAHYQLEGPPGDWDGVFTAEEK